MMGMYDSSSLMNEPTETASMVSPNPLASVSFPRTGKRGVPQQFPRRLYEMLDKESQAESKHRSGVIAWSESGKAFHIRNITEFANTILPKYFRTKKFSSFQRNLNLYGFAKLRRGPEVNMYAHPSFRRGAPELLIQLRKAVTSHAPHSPQHALPTTTSSPLVIPPSAVAAARANHHSRRTQPTSAAPAPSSLLGVPPVTTSPPTPLTVQENAAHTAQQAMAAAAAAAAVLMASAAATANPFAAAAATKDLDAHSLASMILQKHHQQQATMTPPMTLVVPPPCPATTTTRAISPVSSHDGESAPSVGTIGTNTVSPSLWSSNGASPTSAAMNNNKLNNIPTLPPLIIGSPQTSTTIASSTRLLPRLMSSSSSSTSSSVQSSNSPSSPTSVLQDAPLSSTVAPPLAEQRHDRGKLDLLALAMEQELSSTRSA